MNCARFFGHLFRRVRVVGDDCNAFHRGRAFRSARIGVDAQLPSAVADSPTSHIKRLLGSSKQAHSARAVYPSVLARDMSIQIAARDHCRLKCSPAARASQINHNLGAHSGLSSAAVSSGAGFRSCSPLETLATRENPLAPAAPQFQSAQQLRSYSTAAHRLRNAERARATTRAARP